MLADLIWQPTWPLQSPHNFLSPDLSTFGLAHLTVNSIRTSVSLDPSTNHQATELDPPVFYSKLKTPPREITISSSNKSYGTRGHHHHSQSPTQPSKPHLSPPSASWRQRRPQPLSTMTDTFEHATCYRAHPHPRPASRQGSGPSRYTLTAPAAGTGPFTAAPLGGFTTVQILA